MPNAAVVSCAEVDRPLGAIYSQTLVKRGIVARLWTKGSDSEARKAQLPPQAALIVLLTSSASSSPEVTEGIEIFNGLASISPMGPLIVVQLDDAVAPLPPADSTVINASEKPFDEIIDL